jgi:hypothetical protein
MIKRRKIITLLLLILCLTCFTGKVHAQWSFTFTLEVSGTCGSYQPQIPTFSIPYMPDKAFCENLRQQILAISVSGDGCTVYYSATPCVGSDVAISSSPGAVTIDALISGNAFFASHDTRALESWINDYLLKLQSMGIAFDEDNFLTAQDIPLTGVESFDRKYADEILRFEYPTQGGEVDLTGKKGVVDINGTTGVQPTVTNNTEDTDISTKTMPIMGSSPLTAEERERINAYNLKTVQNNSLDESNFQLEESPFWNTPEMKELGVDAAKFTLGTVTGGLGYVAIVGVDVVGGVFAEKSGEQIAVDVATDVLTKGVGDLGGYVVGKGASALSRNPEVAKKTYETLTESGGLLIDSWTNASKIKTNVTK